jgi:serine/threonine protein kinase/tetratricopeptide (TPR) repeat protein
MDDDGKTLPDFDSSKISPAPGSAPNPNKQTGVAASTPPPGWSSSDAPTMAHPDSSSFSSAPTQAHGAPGDEGSGLHLQTGSTLAGRYKILRVLGEGGMGAVYQARDLELERVIAVKVIRPQLAGVSGILQRFKQELILARHVTHKNVVRIYDLGESDGVKFITMEYVEGEDLRHALRRHGKFSHAEAVEVMQQICRALDAAHAEGVIHRDLKPQNVMRDQQGRVVVMDFGLARSLESPGMTQTGALVGTLEYMSPEQAVGGEIDQRSDLFALGLIFYELLTGKAPYQADTGIASLMKRTQAPAPSASDVDGSVPKSLSFIVAKCLERDPQNRYHSAQELMHALDAWQANPSISPSMLAKLGPATSRSSRSVQIQFNMPARRGWLWATAVLVLAATLFAIPSVRHWVFPSAQQIVPGERGIPALSQGKYVAVLPLKVIGDDKSLQYVAEGVAEALAAKMFQLHEVHVAPTSAIDKLRGKDSDLTAVARTLGVNLILQGTVQGTADKFLVTFNLEDMADNRRVWSEGFSGVPRDLLTIEDHVYTNLVSALELKPSADEMARSGLHPTENMAAYDLYLKGRNALRGNEGPRDAEAAINFLDGALKQDPNFALAYTGIADADLRIYKDKRDPMYADKALAAAQTAARLNSDLPEVHLALGAVYNATGKSAEAIDELKKALHLAPNSDEAYSRLGDAYLAGGHKEEAISAYESAVAANPYYWANHNKLAGGYFQTGDAEKALREYQRVTELAADNPVGYENIAAVYFRQGKYGQAIPALEQAVERRPDAINSSNLGVAYFFVKRYADAVKMFEKAVAQSPKNEQLMGNLADAYRWSGHTQQAMQTYDKAIQLAYQDLQVNPKSEIATGDLGLYYAKKGDTARGLQYVRQAREINPADVQLMYYEAQVYAIAGKQAEALKALRAAFDKGYSPEEAQNDPELGKLKDLPEFERLVNEFSKKAS